MAAYAEPVLKPAFSGRNLVELFKTEMAPRPGMYSKLVRVLITVVITFLLVATFCMPYAAITLYSIFTVDRSSRRAAILRACQSVVAMTLGLTMALIGVLLFIDFPALTSSTTRLSYLWPHF